MIGRDRLSLGVCGGVVAIAIFAVGGAPREAQAVVAFAAAVAVATTVTSRRGLERWPPLLVLLLAATGWTLLQLVPLSSGLVHALTPTLDDLRSDGATVAGITPGSTLSMDVPGTLRALAFLLTLSGVAVVALRVAASERGRYGLMAVVALGAGGTALVCGLHAVLGAHSLYGLYHPLHATPQVMGPLLNSNHLGSLMAMGALASASLTLYSHQPVARRAGWMLNGIACAVIMALTLSRGAILAFAAGGVVMLLTLFSQQLRVTEGGRTKRARARLFSTTLPVGIIVTCGITIAIYIGAGSVIQQLENTSLQEINQPTSKFAAWRSTVALVDESPWVGIGRGAFEPVFTRVHPASAFATFSHPENEALQLLVEWGVPAAIGFGVLGIWMLRRAVRRWRDGPIAAGALGMLGAIAFQSNFDFGIEMLGIAVPVALVLAILTYGTANELSPQRLPRVRVLRVAHALVLVCGGLVLLTERARNVEEDHVALQTTHSLEDLRAEITRHPLDYVGYALLAETMVASGDPAMVPVLNHAMRLHPTQSGLHRLAARLLARAGRTSQAESEYSTALRYTLDRRPIVTEMLAILSPAQVVTALPLEAEIDNTVHMFQDLGRTDIAILWLEHELSYAPTLRIAETLYSVAAQGKDLAALETAQRVRCRITPSTQCQIVLAQILARASKPADVVVVLADVATWPGQHAQQREAWLMRCDAFDQLHRNEDEVRCLHDLELSGLVDPAGDDIRRRREALRH